ncbi:MAG: methyltransferase domain-containing protein [Pseudomonadota bacterium]
MIDISAELRKEKGGLIAVPCKAVQGAVMDAFGTALLDYHAGERNHMVRIERDDGFWDEHSAEMYFAPEPFPDEAAALANAEGPLLDIGCGAGRHLLWAEAQSIVATGIDMSPGAVSCAMARGCREVIEGDVAAMDLGARQFATATLFGNNIGIGGSWEGAVALLAAIGRVMRPEGRLALTSLNVSRTENPQHLAYHAKNTAAGVPKGELTMRIHYKDLVDPWIKWFHPQPEELRAIARNAGWHVADLVEDSNGFYWAGLRWPG